LHPPGVEPGPIAWKAIILPLDQECLMMDWLLFINIYCYVANFCSKASTRTYLLVSVLPCYNLVGVIVRLVYNISTLNYGHKHDLFTTPLTSNLCFDNISTFRPHIQQVVPCEGNMQGCNLLRGAPGLRITPLFDSVGFPSYAPEGCRRNIRIEGDPRVARIAGYRL
jgi:hypothetical protein